MIKHILKLIWNKRGSNALMILEILLSFVVLFVILAFVFFNMEREKLPLGFDYEDKWRVSLDELYQQDSVVIVEAMTNLQREFRDMEEVKSVTFTKFMTPFINSVWQTSSDEHGFEIDVQVVMVDLDFMKTMGIQINDGRWFDEQDLSSEQDPVLVNQRFMDKYFPDKSMLDSTLMISGEHKLIGVLEDYRYMGEFSEPWAMMFVLEPFHENHHFAMLDMKDGTPATTEQEIVALANRYTNQTSCTVEYLEKERVDNNRDQWMMIYALMAICIFLCLNVALGLFGVLWYNISRRKSEVGLRQAMGAHGGDISRQFIAEMLILAGFALVIGLFFALQIPILNITEYDDSLFYKAAAYASVIILVLVFVCALLPSLQAARIRPATTLRED